MRVIAGVPAAVLIFLTPTFAQKPLNRPGWVFRQTLGPASLGAGVFTSSIATARCVPEEYGRDWAGFGQRYGMRLTGIATQNVIEAGVGAMYDDDPRYRKMTGAPVKQRILSVIRQSVVRQTADGRYVPAYARYAGIVGGNFLSNTWRPDSTANASSALLRSVYGFLGKMAGNAYSEFGSDAMRLIRR